MASRKRKIAFETLASPVRPNYFHGQLLSERDLLREQEYFRNKIRLALRLAHGWGVVSGLDVTVEQGEVVVSPGVAIDCRGQELVVESTQRQPLAGVRGKRFVTLCFEEVPIEPTPSLGDKEELVGHAATREAARIELATVDPLAAHGRFKPRDGGCGKPHALTLATVSRIRARWKVTLARRLRG